MAEDSAGQDTGTLDVRVEPLEPPEGGFQIVTPEYRVPPNSDHTWCYFGTYTGPAVGVDFYQWFQAAGYGHHLMVLDASKVVGFEDGAMFDCTDPVDAMDMPSLFAGTELLGEGEGRMVLPEDTAIRFPANQRWAISTHYVNSSDRELLAQDAVNIGIIAEDEVRVWAGSWSFNDSTFTLPAASSTQVEVVCEWPSDVNVHSMMGHMHNHGTSILVTYDHDGVSDEIYNLPAWDPAWTYEPQLVGFDEGQLTPKGGETFTTTCNFTNDTDASVVFPQEMCVAAGLAWPIDTPISCDSGR